MFCLCRKRRKIVILLPSRAFRFDPIGAAAFADAGTAVLIPRQSRRNRSLVRPLGLSPLEDREVLRRRWLSPWLHRRLVRNSFTPRSLQHCYLTLSLTIGTHFAYSS